MRPGAAAIVAAICLALASACGSAGASSSSPDARPGGLTGPLPAALPAHLGIGVAAQPDSTGLFGWMPHTRIPFDYAYQYLSGGVNTGSGWQNWDPGGSYAIRYADDAATRGYVAVFDYYMLRQSRGPCSSCSEAERDLAHLNDRALMAAYYADFATLMKTLGAGSPGRPGFGRSVIVHVEPDLSGYAEQASLDARHCFGHCRPGEDGDPSRVGAAVADTGVPEVRQYPDTYRGFNLALLHLRDLYAPNVLLAFHVSDWATGTDVGTNADSSVDVRRLGSQAGQFAASSGVVRSEPGTSTYDVVFNDVADRDAQVSGTWWDRTNRVLPDFRQWEGYLGAVASSVHKPIFVWQVPLGNQWFDTENGSPGHTQDNRVEYFLGHPGELVRSGVAAVLFGRGNAGSTTDTDDLGDGVTNPAPVCTGAGMGAGDVCTDHLSHHTDDDGGYLREAAARYYKHPVPLQASHTGRSASVPPRPPD